MELQPITESLLWDGLLEPCLSPFNTLILPVKKLDVSYRLVQDLRAINQFDQSRHHVVPNPYTLLSKIPHDHTLFTFWACPLTKESRDVFAFDWENLITGRKQQYRWTVLPQVFTDLPSLFGQTLKQVLEKSRLSSQQLFHLCSREAESSSSAISTWGGPWTLWAWDAW